MSEEKAAPERGWIRRVVGYMKPHKRNAYIAFGTAIAGTLIQSFTPLVTAIIVDDVILHHNKPLAPWLAVLVVFGIARFGFAYVRRYRGGRISLDVAHDLRTAIFGKLQQLDFARHDELQTGQLVSRASSDVTLLQGFLQFLPIGVANILSFIVAICVMLYLSPLLTVVMLCVAPALLITSIKLRTSVFPASWDAQQKQGDVANVVEEAVTGVRVVKGFGQEQQELDRLTERSERMLRVAGAARAVAGAAATRAPVDPVVRPGRGAAARWLARHRRSRDAGRVPRVRELHDRSDRSGASARGDPDRRATRPRWRRAHLRPPRLHAARARQAGCR